MAEPPQYSDDDIKAIIDRALERQGGGHAGATHSDLLAIGEQIGVSAGEMEQAAREVRDTRLDTEATRRVLAGHKRWLLAHAALFAILNGLLFAVNALTTPGEWWVLFSVVFWGLALGLHTGVALGTGVSKNRVRRERALVEKERDSSRRTQVRVAEASTPGQATEAPQEPAAQQEAERSSLSRQR